MNYIIEVLKDTPFHSRGTKLKMIVQLLSNERI